MRKTQGPGPLWRRDFEAQYTMLKANNDFLSANLNRNSETILP